MRMFVVNVKSIGRSRRKTERSKINKTVLYPTARIKFELLKRRQESEKSKFDISSVVKTVLKDISDIILPFIFFRNRKLNFNNKTVV